ncbi:MAG: hypothetical protein ACOC5A_02230 [Halanaerobiales bacterium]
MERYYGPRVTVPYCFLYSPSLSEDFDLELTADGSTGVKELFFALRDKFHGLGILPEFTES